MTRKSYTTSLTLQSLKKYTGFSLVELMVAIALGIFLVLGVTNILFSGQQSFNATNRIARVQENGQLAKNMLIDDLKRARYMGPNIELQNLAGTAIAANPNVVDSAPTCNANWGLMIRQGLFGLDNNDIDNNGAIYACITGINVNPGIRVPGTDILTVRYASPWQATIFNAQALYIRSTFTNSWIFTGNNVNNAANDEQSSGIAGVTDTDPINSTHELIAYSYYVGNSGRQCAGQAIPSLFRVGLDNNGQPQREEIFPGIEDFQVQFSVDGTTYQDADAVTDWSTVRATQIWLLARSECQEGGHNDNRTYTLAGIDYTPNNGNGDGFRRQLYTSISSHRN